MLHCDSTLWQHGTWWLYYGQLLGLLERERLCVVYGLLDIRENLKFDAVFKLAIIRRWQHKMLIFDLEPHFHGSNTYILMSLTTDLYIRILFSVGIRDLLPIGHCSCLVLIFTCFVYFMTWYFQISLLSKCSSKRSFGICTLFIVTAGQLYLQRVNVINTVCSHCSLFQPLLEVF